jgi:hypothetical protein
MNVPLWIQNVLVLLIVAGAAAIVLRNAIASLRGSPARLGSCCAKGCAAAAAATAPDATKKSGERIVFLPVESLARRKPSK